MSRPTAISLVGAVAIGAGLLGTSPAFAAPADGAVIAASQVIAASTGELTQTVAWYGHVGGWRGAGLRGVAWRGAYGYPSYPYAYAGPRARNRSWARHYGF
jgi:hypothetical protein